MSWILPRSAWTRGQCQRLSNHQAPQMEKETQLLTKTMLKEQNVCQTWKLAPLHWIISRNQAPQWQKNAWFLMQTTQMKQKCQINSCCAP
uniref:Uncharacterized protein n=1 Tax=Arundo donax TaxID=35708 RepID=A0A0A9DW05_ARUDO